MVRIIFKEIQNSQPKAIRIGESTVRHTVVERVRLREDEE